MVLANQERHHHLWEQPGEFQAEHTEARRPRWGGAGGVEVLAEGQTAEARRMTWQPAKG